MANKTKGQPTQWEKIFAKDATHKGLISKYTNSSCRSILKKKHYNQKMGRRYKQALLQWRCTDGQKPHEKMLNIANY